MRDMGNDGTRNGGLYGVSVAIPLAAKLVAQNLVQAGADMDVVIAAYNEGIGRAQEDAANGTPWRTTDPQYINKVRAAVTAYLPALPADSGPTATARGNGVTTVSVGAGLGIAALVGALV